MGWALIIYYMLLNEVVSITYVFDLMIYSIINGFRAVTQGIVPEFDTMMEVMMERMLTNFWGYLLAIAIGFLILLLWKGKNFWRQQIWAKEQTMTGKTFGMLLVLVIACQAVTQILTPLQEWLLNQFGLSAMAALESATITGDSLSMFLYVSFVGPFAEEILFRGLILRSLKPYGKQFAIFVSSLLFALFHGNVIQIPYAFLVGLLLAYVTVEYSITWAILLHIFNNFVLADLMSRLAEFLPPYVGEGILLLLIACAAIGAVIIGICRRKEIAAYAKENTLGDAPMRGFVKAPGVWVFMVLMLGMAALLLTL